MTRRNHSAAFKAKAALAQPFDLHPNQNLEWKKQLVKG